jgi:hypothetical protein
MHGLLDARGPIDDSLTCIVLPTCGAVSMLYEPTHPGRLTHFPLVFSTSHRHMLLIDWAVTAPRMSGHMNARVAPLAGADPRLLIALDTDSLQSSRRRL